MLSRESESMIDARKCKVGDRVRLTELPPWTGQLPARSHAVIQFCLGKYFPIGEIDTHGLYVLDVSREVDGALGGFGNDIRVEEMYLANELNESGLGGTSES